MTAAEQMKLEEILKRYEGTRGVLIQALLDVQHELKWIAPEAVDRISKRIKIPLSKVYRVASFYKAISLTPRGRHIVRVCLGTACHVRGGAKIMDKVQELLGLKNDGTTEDLKFTLERVNCLGCCALGPVMVVDDNYYGEMTPGRVAQILESFD